MQNLRPLLNYLMFLEVVIYVNPKLSETIYRGNSDACKNSISALLELQPNNIELWFAYIEAEHLKNSNTEECCGVYTQLFKLEGLTRKKLYLILYNFYASLKRWKGDTNTVLVALLEFLKQQLPPSFDGSHRLSMFDVLQLQNLLLSRYQEVEDRKPSARHPQPHRLTKRHILSYFALEISSLYEPSQ